MEDIFSSLNGFPPNTTSTSGYQYPPRRAYTHPHTAPLQVATNVENDPSEATARPSNAHVHAQFHSLSLPPTGMSTSSVQPIVDHSDRQLFGEEFSQATSLGLTKSLSRPLLPDEVERLAHLDRLKFFLATAPTHWTDPTNDQVQSNHAVTPTNPHSSLYRFMLPNQEYVSCVRWGNIFHITGTDIVRALVFRFEAFGRPVKNMKKFEEGVFSDLRNLKPGHDATLEEPKSPFLDLLFRHQAIRTQKKQKVFYWFSVPHDRLFLDALERDLKREKVGLEPTTKVEGEPALSFTYDKTRGLYEQFCGTIKDADDNGDGDGDEGLSGPENGDPTAAGYASDTSGTRSSNRKVQPQTPYSGMFTLFEGSPMYKQRRKKSTRGSSGLNMMVNTDARSRSNSRGYDPSYGVHDRTTHYDHYSAADMFRMQARRELIKQEESGYDAPDDEAYGRAFRCPLVICSTLFSNQEALRVHLAEHQLSRPSSSSGSGFNGDVTNAMFSDLSKYEINLTEHLVEGEGGLLRPVTAHSTGSSIGSYPGANYTSGLDGAQEVFYADSPFSGPPSSDYNGSEYDYAERWALSSAPGSVQSFTTPLPNESAIDPSAYGGAASASFTDASGFEPTHTTYPNQQTYMTSDFSSYPTSVSAPSHQQAFDHEQFAHLRLSQSPSLQPIHPSSRPSSSYYARSNRSSSVTGSPGPSAALTLQEGGTGPVRRHVGMSGSVAASQPITIAQSNSGGRRPVTASSGVNPSNDFAMMQQASRGRGYHPYAGGYIARSHSSASSSSARSSPATHPVSLPMHDMNALGLDRQGGGVADGSTDFSGMEMYRTDSPALVAYGQREMYPTSMDLDSVNVGYPGLANNGRYYGRQGQQQVAL